MHLLDCIVEETPFGIRVHDPGIPFEFELFGMAPVQAVGTICKRDFFFHAKYTEWTCEVSDSNGNLPTNGQSAVDGFIRKGRLKDASYIPIRDALKIIETCVCEYLEQAE